ncbi:hypothetical protein PUNSTDRAFT_109062 [Punctularia strigosozonata HHB-11173 SS5]|uniref:Uncharacterized protein n=1 Tax=Punctularia strigosozonata (strain HHB-11173) TaxID=741275 RepID=R7S219_PUNST|nr:uncharacterized protein PUNSTDRAFT_109062 [Punctularia strigosozonata HHB-11173 SS5]EIN03914.1 hypothetical protein PUNSTDRAFT_109062 [Punctularia strigosozonata HHB-11173 SS5]
MVVFGDSLSSKPWKTWVDYIPRQRDLSGMSIHNFAVPGATAEDDLAEQLAHFFARFPKKQLPASQPVLDPSQTLYVLFLGVNDCGRTEEDELEAIIEGIFDAVHDLYVKAGARNFLFVDVPPKDRSPAAVDFVHEIRARIETWNGTLRTLASDFAQEASQASVFVFSSHVVVGDILDNHENYGFTDDDIAEEGGNFWLDDLHITGDVHEVLAERLIKALLSVQARSTEE